MLKGAATWIPLVGAMRARYAQTGGTNSARYCYTVWLRHLVTLSRYGFEIRGARVGELGPGDSIGTGLAALLAGAQTYVGLDVIPFSLRHELESIFDELVRLYSKKEPIPDDHEFPRVRPKLVSYEFPNHLVEWSEFHRRTKLIKTELRRGIGRGNFVTYIAPWTSLHEVRPNSLDLIFSQSVLEYVSSLSEAYRAMATWLKPGAYSSDAIDLSAMYLSPYWNGHWAYSDWEWKLVQGRRHYFLNREPLTTHLEYAAKAGLEVVALENEYNSSGLPSSQLSRRFRAMTSEDHRARGAMIILRKIAR
jgi:Methyltransferase domain